MLSRNVPAMLSRNVSAMFSRNVPILTDDELFRHIRTINKKITNLSTAFVTNSVKIIQDIVVKELILPGATQHFMKMIYIYDFLHQNFQTFFGRFSQLLVSHGLQTFIA